MPDDNRLRQWLPCPPRAPKLINSQPLKRRPMNKNELIGQIAAKSGLSKADANRALNAVTETITEALKKGEPYP